MNLLSLLVAFSACSLVAAPCLAQLDCYEDCQMTASVTEIEPPLPACAAAGIGVLEEACGCILTFDVDNGCDAPIEALGGFVFDICGPTGSEMLTCGAIAPGARGSEIIDLTDEPGTYEVVREVSMDGTVYTLSVTGEVAPPDDEDGCACSLTPRPGSNLLVVVALLLTAAARRRAR
jgi:hypothetical protein